MARDEHGSTPLHWAARSDNPAKMRVLLEAGADATAKTNGMHFTPLFSAAASGNALNIQALIAAGADVMARGGLSSITPLHVAAGWEGSAACIKALVAAGADVMDRASNGNTALHQAVYNPDDRTDVTGIVQALLAAGADAKAKNRDGETPWDLAQELAKRKDEFKSSKAYWALNDAQYN